MKRLVILGPALVILGIAALIDLPQTLGAHPWWSVKTLLIGAPIGLVLGYFLRLRIAPIGFSALLLLSYFTAKTGQTRFAASYAEDAFAGQLWYFGWIAIAVMAAALLVSVSRWAVLRRG